jgi:uncharacterized protein YehS (DUF1456 family)|tara:strand:- start:4054 stop:4575 length:522 start_codon:yes stop_codon:yes gene_type:complete
MTNNDVLRRIRYILDYNNKTMLSIFSLGGRNLSIEQLKQQLKKDIDSDFLNCSDINLASFLNGLIIKKRGDKDGLRPQAEKNITNNMIFTKLKIAFNLTSDDILEILSSIDFHLSAHELSSFFRKRTHKNHRECKDQVLRNFLKGLQIKYRDQDDLEEIEASSIWKPLPSHKK